MNIVYLHLGSNQNEPLKQILRAYGNIEVKIGEIESYSHFYKTAAWGMEDQADFINSAIKVRTELTADGVLERILAIEKTQGRKRLDKWGPRIIDIDIIFYNDEILKSDHLEIPHCRLAERNFVLIPMMDIAGDHIDPRSKMSIEDLYLKSTDNKNVILL